MSYRRRRSDQLPSARDLSGEPVERALDCCRCVMAAGYSSGVAMVVDCESETVAMLSSNKLSDVEAKPLRDAAFTLLRRGGAFCFNDAPIHNNLTVKHAAFPIARMGSKAIVLVVSDPQLTKRDAQALAVWSAWESSRQAKTNAHEEGCAVLAQRLAQNLEVDVVAIALFATSGMRLMLHLRSGASVHNCRVPTDTVWGEAARHGAAFMLGDLSTHAGTEVLGRLGMQQVSLVGIENGSGLAIGALGVASDQALDPDIAHDMLALAPSLGPEVMSIMSSTRVPVPDADGTVDLGVLAARVGCYRFAMYERVGVSMQLACAYDREGARLDHAPDEAERELVRRAAQQGAGVVGDRFAAVLIGSHTVLYAEDPSKKALDCLRLALQDVRRNPFGAAAPDDNDDLLAA